MPDATRRVASHRIALRRPSESKIATSRLAACRARGKLNPGKQRSKIVGVNDNAGMFLDGINDVILLLFISARNCRWNNYCKHVSLEYCGATLYPNVKWRILSEFVKYDR